ncbi:MAG: mitochondrial fission ELM1 family protein [Pseudomonadota bacterium]
MQRSAPTRSRVLTDGHAGNLRQARALADALGLPTQSATLQPRVPWKWAAPRRLPGSEAAFGDALDGIDAATLAIGCGRQAALATRLLRERGVPVVQILDPRIDPRHWDVVVAPEHDRLRGANVITLQGSLNPVGDAWLAAARAAFAGLGALPGPRTALLVGGPTPHLRLGLREFERWLAMVRQAIERDGGSVLATASRRTPAAFVDAMRRRLAGLPGLVWTGSVDGRNPYAALLGWADRIVCTADSVNMLSEAAATPAPLYVAGTARIRGRPGRFVQALAARGRIRALDDALAAFDVVPLRETARVAAQVRARLV